MVATKKRSTPSNKTAAKRPVAKKAASRPRATAVRVSKKPSMQSFKLARQDQPFLSLNPSVQTLYWTVIGVIAIVFTTWILTLQSQIYKIYDQIDVANSEDSVVVPAKKQ